MLENIVKGLEHHNATCPMPARAILLNPGNYELFGWNELMGVPVEPRDGVPPKRFRIDCSGSAYGIEEAVEDLVGRPLETEPQEEEVVMPVPFMPNIN